MPHYSHLLSSRQYLTLDLLEGLCARAREVTQSAFERGESLSNEELFNLIMIDMACKADELHDLQSLLMDAEAATGSVLEELQGGPQEVFRKPRHPRLDQFLDTYLDRGAAMLL